MSAGKSGLDLELRHVLEAVCRHERTIPLLAQSYSTTKVAFRPMPTELLDIIRTSSDYVEIVPGENPTWIKFIVDDNVLELVVYRTFADDAFYILGPVSTLQ